ncbi:retrovirus-related pol polyprotein from transposon TNT 1-94 [Tanacetum coccineum]
MHDEFEMSLMGELNFFLGLQIKQMEDDFFFNQSKYIKEMLKKFGLEDSKPMKTFMSSDTKLTKDEECELVDSTKYRGMIGTTHLGLWYPKGTDIETVVYVDSDHAGDCVDRKSTSEFGQILDIPSNGACSFTDKWSGHYSLAYFVAKRMEFFTKQPRLILPYGMLLTRLFKYVIFVNPGLSNDRYVLYDRVMYPLTAQQERRTQKDYGTRRGRSSTSSSSAFGQPSSSHLNDDDNDGNDEGTLRASTPSPTRFVNSLTNEVPRVFSNPPNIDPNTE